MVNIEKYIQQLIELLRKQFSSRLLYVGLQGSYLRGEANSDSDIDIMVVIADLNVSDLTLYRKIINALEYSEKSCGFICGAQDLCHWNPLEICSLLHTTKDYYGTLREFTPDYSEADLRNFLKMSINNLYHELCHRYIHSELDKNYANLPLTYKSVFFILQNLYFLKTKEFIGTKAALLTKMQGKDYEVLKRSLELANNTVYNFDESFELIFFGVRKPYIHFSHNIILKLRSRNYDSFFCI